MGSFDKAFGDGRTGDALIETDERDTGVRNRSQFILNRPRLTAVQHESLICASFGTCVGINQRKAAASRTA
jgi:hypothetical protein